MTARTDPATDRPGTVRWGLILVPMIMLAGWLSGQPGGGPGEPWFDSLRKPAIFPPPATFGIVWPLLYLMMGVALAMVVARRGARLRGAAIVAFIVQLGLNLAWSPLFFAGHQISAALWLLLAIDGAVVVTLVLFWRVKRLAGLLLVPYLAWVLFATALNYQFLVLNPAADGAASPVTID